MYVLPFLVSLLKRCFASTECLHTLKATFTLFPIKRRIVRGLYLQRGEGIQEEEKNLHINYLSYIGETTQQ